MADRVASPSARGFAPFALSFCSLVKSNNISFSVATGARHLIQKSGWEHQRLTVCVLGWSCNPCVLDSTDGAHDRIVNAAYRGASALDAIPA